MPQELESREFSVANLLIATDILVRHGVLDSFGHASVRHPEDANAFLMARSVSPLVLTPEDILSFDFNGDVLGTPATPVFVERFIHGAIYAARSDVRAIVHSHSASVVPFTVAQTPLRALSAVSGFIGNDVPHFDTRDHIGDSDLLIRDAALGKALASCLGDRSIALLRGHGFVVVAASLPHAVYRAIYAERSASMQDSAERLGTVTYLSPREIELSTAGEFRAAARAWDFWKSQIQ